MRKFDSIAKRSGPSGDPNCPPYARKATAAKKSIIEKTDGSTGSNRGGEGFGSDNEVTATSLLKTTTTTMTKMTIHLLTTTTDQH